METQFTDTAQAAPTPPPAPTKAAPPRAAAPTPPQTAAQTAAATTDDGTGHDLYNKSMFHAVIVKDGGVHTLSQNTKKGLLKSLADAGDFKLVKVFRGKMVLTRPVTTLTLG